MCVYCVWNWPCHASFNEIIYEAEPPIALWYFPVTIKIHFGATQFQLEAGLTENGTNWNIYIHRRRISDLSSFRNEKIILKTVIQFLFNICIIKMLLTVVCFYRSRTSKIELKKSWMLKKWDENWFKLNIFICNCYKESGNKLKFNFLCLINVARRFIAPYFLNDLCLTLKRVFQGNKLLGVTITLPVTKK